MEIQAHKGCHSEGHRGVTAEIQAVTLGGVTDKTLKTKIQGASVTLSLIGGRGSEINQREGQATLGKVSTKK